MKNTIIFAISIVVLTFGLIIGQWVVSADSRHDAQTSIDLRVINDEINKIYRNDSRIITDINEVINVVGDDGIKSRATARDYELDFLDVVDDDIGLRYSTRRLDEPRYKLCAVFLTDTTTDDFSEDNISYDFNEHKSGRSCFMRELRLY
jgi:hypothetical protein